jgi:hypothetical protein
VVGYRLYFLDANSRIQARQDFVAEDDGEAQMIGRLLWRACADCYEGYELWQTARRLAYESTASLSAAFAVPSIEQIDCNLQNHLLELQETMLSSHWQAARSGTLLAATETLRRLTASGPAAISHQDLVRYICGKTGTRMMSLQLADGMRLMLRGSRGFNRVFDEFFAVVATGHCACGVAFKDARQIIVPAIDSSPIYAGQESLLVLRAQGVAACISTPFLGGDGKVAGMFSILRDAVWNPADGELAEMQHIANDIAAAMADPLSVEARRMRAAV